jgi:hypothetical protein
LQTNFNFTVAKKRSAFKVIIYLTIPVLCRVRITEFLFAIGISILQHSLLFTFSVILARTACYRGMIGNVHQGSVS